MPFSNCLADNNVFKLFHFANITSNLFRLLIKDVFSFGAIFNADHYQFLEEMKRIFQEDLFFFCRYEDLFVGLLSLLPLLFYFFE